MFTKGKKSTLSEMLAGYEKLDKANIEANEGILIDDVFVGYSEDTEGYYCYVLGSYKARPVYVTVPSSSIEQFACITASDVEEIRANNLKMYVEARTSKKGRLYYIAWIDD